MITLCTQCPIANPKSAETAAAFANERFFGAGLTIFGLNLFPVGVHRNGTLASHRGLCKVKPHRSEFRLRMNLDWTIFQRMPWIIKDSPEAAVMAHRHAERAVSERVWINAQALPGHNLAVRKMPGHWLLARLGKRVLRPGGLELTRRLIDYLDIRPSDSVVEFAPGLGVTARLALGRGPSSYTAVERDETAARNLRRVLVGPRGSCVCGSADQTGLSSGTATVVYGEAMLTMQGPTQKAQIVREAFRLLQPGGRYGIHELCFTPENLDESIKHEVEARLTETIHVRARPLTVPEWRGLLEKEGFEVAHTSLAPMRLLEPMRLLRDEGLLGAARFVWNVLRNRDARDRVRAMRRIFRKYEMNMAAVMLVACKPLGHCPNPMQSKRPV